MTAYAMAGVIVGISIAIAADHWPEVPISGLVLAVTAGFAAMSIALMVTRG